MNRSNVPAVLLLHGLCANPMEMRPVARVLRAAGHVVETPILKGYGVDATTVKAGGLKVTAFEEWLEQAGQHYRALASEHASVVVGGLCMGAVLSLALAARESTAGQLLISPTLYFDGWNVSRWRRLLPIAYLPVLRDRLSFTETSPFGLKNERLRSWVAQTMAYDGVSSVGAARLPAAGLFQASRLIRHVKSILPQITTPTHILHATEDDVTSPRSVHVLERRLGLAPTVRWFDDSYHMLTLDNEREQVAEESLRFVSGLNKQQAPQRHDIPIAA